MRRKISTNFHLMVGGNPTILLLKQIIRFPGSMTEKRFVVQIIDNYGYYSDDILVEVDDFPLYSEGEERCKVFFEFDKEIIRVITKDCSMIYAGYGVYFDGEYKKANK